MSRAEEGRVPVHGGNVDGVARRYGLAPETLLDFSANVDVRVGASSSAVRDVLAAKAREPGFVTRYPDGEYGALVRRLAARLKVDPSAVVIGNGVAALIRHSFAAVRAETALVPIPAFSEYEAASRAVGTKITPFVLRREDGFGLDAARMSRALEHARPQLCVVNNPHNPSGALTRRAELVELAAVARSVGACLVVDEAFIDYVPEESVIAEIAHGGIIVLRSLTKFYGIPGIRIGYAVASSDVRGALREQLPSWPVGRLDVAAALTLLDAVDGESVRAENVRVRAFLTSKLRRLGLVVFDSAANFLLARLADGMPSAGELLSRLVREHRILVRDASSYDGLEPGRYFRVAVRTQSDNERLLSALKVVLRKGEML